MEAILAPVAELLLKTLGSLAARETRSFSGLAGEVDWLRDELRSMRSFLQAAADAVAIKDQVIPALVDRIRDIAHESEDILDHYDLVTARGRVSRVPCFTSQFKNRRVTGHKIQDIRTKLAEISRRRLDYQLEIPGLGSGNASSINFLHGLASSPLVFDGDIVGNENDLEQMLGWVLAGGPELCVVSLVGMGGVGKTTLIKKLYTNTNVKRHFDRCVWIYVSESIRLRELLGEMAKGLMELPSNEVSLLSQQELQESLLMGLSDKRYLIVLDDVWSKRLFDAIKLVLPRSNVGSRVIITTRNNEVASSIIDVSSHVHRLSPLSPEESWALFCKRVFAKDSLQCPEELREVAEGIVKKCAGLPLAVVTVGGMMLRKERTQMEWRRVLDNVYKDFSNDEVDVQQALFSSYKDLPYFLRSCFLFCSIFPQDYEISRKRLIRLWIAEGFIREEEGQVMEDVAENYLLELINRSMIQISMMSSSGRVKACRIHDLLHQLAISVSDKESFSAVCEDQRREIPERARRISFHKKYCNAVTKKGKLQLQSLFMFGIDGDLHFSGKMVRSYMSLRVLDLEEACLPELPSEVGKLIHLRYLGLKGTRITRLPESIKNLHNLQTLDIRRTHLRKLAFGLKSLNQLRHLAMRQAAWSVRLQQGIGCLEKLQSVTGLQANADVVHEIMKLSNLKKLGIEDLQAEDAIHLWSSVNNMNSLSSLFISSKDYTKPLEFITLTHLSSLRKLHIAGCLERLPDWFRSIQNLTKLRLGLSRLSEDPFQILEELPNLVFLQLYEAYQGKVMRCSKTGFKKLKIMILTGLEELEEWDMEEGAMPCIQELWIMSCSRLKMIPAGFQFLATMQRLRLVSMEDDFTMRVNSFGGEDFSKVRHIPSIQVLE